jgi:WD40 repeat protein
MSPDESLVAVGYGDSVIEIWDVASRDLIMKSENCAIASMSMLLFLPDGSGLVSTSSGGDVDFWKLPSRPGKADDAINQTTNTLGGFLHS